MININIFDIIKYFFYYVKKNGYISKTAVDKINATKTPEEIEAGKSISSTKDKVDSHLRYIYGGSVNEKNCEDFFKNGEVDGALPGAASLNPDKFLAIINSAEKI